MSTVPPDSGVFFARDDYASFPRRLATDLIDIAVVGVLWLGVAVVVAASVSEAQLESDRPPLAVLVSLPILLFGYLVILKGSPFRTLGYRICGVRIINFEGVRPSRYALTLRLLFALFGPLNLLLDLVWIPSDRHRQALRDKFAHTYVIREKAEPTGTGPVVYKNFHLLGAAFIFPEVESP